MKSIKIRGIILIVFIPLFVTPAWSENILSSDYDYSIKIAVTINDNDSIIGKLEYSNCSPQYPLQLVTFCLIGGVIHVEPYVFDIVEKRIISKNVHRIQCRPINDKYGGAFIAGTIDFSNELKPQILLLNDGGHTYISNMSEKGKALKMKYLPNVWLGH